MNSFNFRLKTKLSKIYIRENVRYVEASEMAKSVQDKNSFNEQRLSRDCSSLDIEACKHDDNVEGK